MKKLILVLFIFSLLCQIVTGFLYQNMIKETHNMSSTKNKMLKVCKLKFMNRYELHEKVANIPVFVDKFVHSIKFGPFPAKVLQHLSGQMLLLSVFLTGAGACGAIIEEKTIGEIFTYYVFAFIMLYGYFSVSAAVDLKGKREVLKTNLIDYLENNISVRIPQSKKEQERLDALEKEAGRENGRKRIKKVSGEIYEESGKIEKIMADGQEDYGESEGLMAEHKIFEKATQERYDSLEKKPTDIADFTAHKKKEKKNALAPEEMKELEGLLVEFVYQS